MKKLLTEQGMGDGMGEKQIVTKKTPVRKNVKEEIANVTGSAAPGTGDNPDPTKPLAKPFIGSIARRKPPRALNRILGGK